MRKKRYAVPDGMLKAAERAYNDCIFENNRSEETVEAAVRWLAKNPIVPSCEQLADIYQTVHPNTGTHGDGGWKWLARNFGDGPAMFSEWQKRMFLEPEPEVPAAKS